MAHWDGGTTCWTHWEESGAIKVLSDPIFTALLGADHVAVLTDGNPVPFPSLGLGSLSGPAPTAPLVIAPQRATVALLSPESAALGGSIQM